MLNYALSLHVTKQQNYNNKSIDEIICVECSNSKAKVWIFRKKKRLISKYVVVKTFQPHENIEDF